jgi:hypothetical protein
MASHHRSDTSSADNGPWSQDSFSSNALPGSAYRYAGPRTYEFSQPSITTPAESQPHELEPDPLRRWRYETFSAHEPTQRKAHALAVCGCRAETDEHQMGVSNLSTHGRIVHAMMLRQTSIYPIRIPTRWKWAIVPAQLPGDKVPGIVRPLPARLMGREPARHGLRSMRKAIE